MVKRRLFRYKGVTAIVIAFNFFMLLLFGFGTFDTYSLLINEINGISFIGYSALFFLGFIFLLTCIAQVMILVKYSKSIMFLNIYYGFLIVMFLISAFLQRFGDIEKNVSSSDYLILAGLIGSLIFLVILINKFKYRGTQYEGIDLIGQHKE